MFVKHSRRCYPLLFSLLIIFFNNAIAGDKPAAAYIQHIAIDYSNSDILYAATIGAGLFRSENGAQQWQKINPIKESEAYYFVKIDPENPVRIFAGGEESGVWLSENRGKSWQLIGLQGMTVVDLAIDPANPNRVFVLASDGVYRNTDIISQKWKQVFDYEDFVHKYISEHNLKETWRYTRFQKIAISPHDPATIFIGARWEGGYHFSEDGGDTWQHEWISGIFRRADPILFHPEDPNIIYLGTHHQGMFKSYNAGRSWVAMSRGQEPEIRTPFYGAFLISGLALDPSNPNILYTGSDYSNWKTTNGGRTWQELGKTLTCEFARAFAVDPRRPSIVYAGTNVGLYKSTDAGDSWRSVEIKQTLDVTISGEQFRFALTKGRPPVYRKSSTRNSNWLPISWRIYESGDSLSYDKSRGELILFTENSTYRSKDGGLRWDVPRISYAPVRSLPVPAPSKPGGGDNWVLAVSIRGDVFFEDAAVDSFYKRPPFVSLQLVSPDYPCDHSTPIWSTNWERYLTGIVEIPWDSLPENNDYLLYVEVRDFQKNVQVGTATVKPEKDRKVTIDISPDFYLPCMK